MFKYGSVDTATENEIKKSPFSFKDCREFPSFQDPASPHPNKGFLRDYLGDDLVDTGTISAVEISKNIFKTQIKPVLEAHEQCNDIDMAFDSNQIIQSGQLGRKKLSRDPGIEKALAKIRNFEDLRTPSGAFFYVLPIFIDLCKIAYALSKYPDKRVSITISGRDAHISRLGERRHGDIRNTCYEKPFRKRPLMEHPKAVTVWGAIDNSKMFRGWGFIDTYEMCVTNFYSVPHSVHGGYLSDCNTFPQAVLAAYIAKHFGLSKMHRLSMMGFNDRFNESARDRGNRCPYINSGSSVQYTN